MRMEVHSYTHTSLVTEIPVALVASLLVTISSPFGRGVFVSAESGPGPVAGRASEFRQPRPLALCGAINTADSGGPGRPAPPAETGPGSLPPRRRLDGGRTAS